MIIPHRKTSNEGIELIKKFEGFKAQKYICAGGFKTIGYGHKLLPLENYERISLESAEELLLKDLIKFERAVIKYIEVEINNNQFDALVSFTFNLGPAALQRSSLRQKVNRKSFNEATIEFLRWVYVGTKRLNGLYQRRLAESILFSKNRYM